MAKDNIQDPASSFAGRMDKILDFERDEDLNIYQRIHAVMRDVWYIRKEGDAGHYKTVEHDDVTRKVRPSLVKHGIVVNVVDIEESEPRFLEKTKSGRNGDYTVTEAFSQAKVWVKFTNIDDPEDFVVTPTYASAKDQNALSLSGKIISYAVKYAFMKTLTLETGIEEGSEVETQESSDMNAVHVFNDLGEELFGDKWEKMAQKKIYSITGGKTSEASRAPAPALMEAIRNLHELKKEKQKEPEKDIEEVDKKKKQEDTDDDIISDFNDL